MNIDWKKWGDREYMDDTTLEYQVNLYKSLFSLYNIKSKNMTLLEIGAGHGDFTLMFEKLFKKITAVDPEKTLIDKLNEKIIEFYLSSKIETHVCGCEDFITKKKFNLIAFTYSFLWVFDKQKCLLNTTKLLTKNGYILLIEPSLRYEYSLDKKFTKQTELMNDTLQTFFNSKKLNLVHFLTHSCSNIYLFQKI